MSINCVKGVLEELQDNGFKTLEIYCIETMKKNPNYWWSDISCDILNSECGFFWTWAIKSRKYFLENIINEARTASKTEMNQNSDWIIIVNGTFSKELLCDSIKEWVRNAGFDFDIKMVESPEDDQEECLVEITDLGTF